MKKISFANNYHEMKSIFDGIRTGKEEVILWQKSDDSRIVRFALIEKNIFEQKLIWFKAKSSSDFGFKRGQIYCYIDGQKVVFKCELGECDGIILSIPYPDELTLLAEEDSMTSDMIFIRGHGEGNLKDINRVKGGKADVISDYMKVKGGPLEPSSPFDPDDEEKFSAMRESQRVQPKGDKKVLVLKDGDVEGNEFKLLDLSQGGAGLLVLNQSDFNLKEVVNLIAIDGKALDKILRGEVVAIRPMDGTQEFKVGIKFFT